MLFSFQLSNFVIKYVSFVSCICFLLCDQLNCWGCYAEIVSSLTFESMFYVGLAIFLRITDRVQRPYLQFSPKRWGLITGLRGYLTSAFFTTGLKVVAPLFAVYITWPVLRLPALVAVLPFLVGCAAQLAFETNLDKRGSSCWPLIPIIFEVVSWLIFIFLRPKSRIY